MFFTEPRKIFEDIYELRDRINELKHSQVVLTSGGYAPITFAHVRCIREAAKLLGPETTLIVVVNSDEWLMRKKGFVAVPESERMEIVAALEGVDYVVKWDDGGPTVSGAIEILKPKLFAKGGDRNSPENIPEYEICKKVGCEVIFGVGGFDKVQSSSNIIENIRKHIESEKKAPSKLALDVQNSFRESVQQDVKLNLEKGNSVCGEIDGIWTTIKK